MIGWLIDSVESLLGNESIFVEPYVGFFYIPLSHLYPSFLDYRPVHHIADMARRHGREVLLMK